MEKIPSGQIVQSLIKIIQPAQGHVMLFLSGGSQLNWIPELFKQLPKSGVSLNDLCVTVTDDRFESPYNPRISNFEAIINLEGVTTLIYAQTEFQQIVTSDRTLHQAENYLENMINLQCNRDDTTTIAVIGIGEDGHMMGIVPHNLKHSSIFYAQPVLGYDTSKISDNQGDYRYRVTITFDGLSKMDHILVYAVGQSKHEIIEELLATDNPTPQDIATKPALFLSKLNNVTIFTG